MLLLINRAHVEGSSLVKQSSILNWNSLSCRNRRAVLLFSALQSQTSTVQARKEAVSRREQAGSSVSASCDPLVTSGTLVPGIHQCSDLGVFLDR